MGNEWKGWGACIGRKCIAVLPDLAFFPVLHFAPDPLPWVSVSLLSVSLLVSPALIAFPHFQFPWAFLLQPHIPVGSAAGVWHRLAGCQLWQRAIENCSSLFVPYHGIWDLQENQKEILLFTLLHLCRESNPELCLTHFIWRHSF